MIKYIFIALLIFPLSACLEKEDDNNSSLSMRTLTIVNDLGKEFTFNVELALTHQEQSKGLMHRTEMAEDAGMLFYFGGAEAERGFWMKNTLIPLDLIFIKADGTIHHIHENSVPHDLTSMRSFGPVAAVLEINGGLAAKYELFPDDKVHHPFFK